MSAPSKFSTTASQNFDNYDLHSQMVDKACQVALREGVVTEGTLEKFMQGGDNLFAAAKKFRDARTEPEQLQQLESMRAKARFTPQEQGELANLMDILMPVINAANSVREDDQPNSRAKKIFKNYLIAGLTKNQDQKNAFGMDPQSWVEQLKDIKSELLISLVNTAHPTNFFTPYGRKFQQSLIEIVEDARFTQKNEKLDKHIYDVMGKDSKESPDHLGILKQDVLDGKFEALISNTCHDLLSADKTITYTKKVTVGEESDTERDVLKVEKTMAPNVFKAWEEALHDKDVLRAGILTLGPDHEAKLGALALTNKEKQNAYQQRSWIRAGADKDGRDEATDVALYVGYMQSLEDGVYKGPILDLRENAEVRKKALDALISTRYKGNEAFREACNEFCSHPAEPINSFTAGTDLFQKLSEKNQQAFLEFLMEREVDLFNRDAVRTEAIGFNEKFYPIYKQLLEQNHLDKNTPVHALPNDAYASLLARLSGIKGAVELGKGRPDRVGGYGIDRIHEQTKEGYVAGVDPDPAVLGVNYKHKKLPGQLIEGKPKNGGGEQTLNEMESLSCMSYIRRLFLMNKFVDEQKGKAIVADKEETANFSNASDFFAQMYFFQQAGLITIEKGRVVGMPKLGLTPLFETTEDMKNAPKILDAILESKLGASYYEARGKAELMVGYSDGAKSGGNFASHVRIREFERMATEKFKKKFGPDFQVIIKRGPGRGENRGGTRTYDRQYMLHHDSVNETPINYQTVQGDLPIRMQMEPKFAERTLAEMMVSTFAGAVEARREKSPLEVRRTQSFEAVCNYLADHSEAHYGAGIFAKAAECDDLMKTVVKNPDASSRAVKRGDTAQPGIGPQRAITVESATKIMHLPMLDYGLKHALKQYIADPEAPPVLDEKGNEVHGRKALEILARDHNFFREQMKLAVLRQQSFHPIIADSWAKKAGQSAFVDSIKAELTGLGDLAQSLLSRKREKAPSRQDYSREPYTQGLADSVQAILASNEQITPSDVKKLYLPLYAPISEQPAGPMQGYIPGLGVPVGGETLSR